MARIKLVFPEKACFQTTIPIRITDLNYGNHVGNDAIVSMLHEARVQWLNAGGFSEMDAGGTGLIQADLIVQYLNESFYGDQLQIELSIGEISTSTFEVYYSIKRTVDEKNIALAKTTLCCFNYVSRKPQAIAEIFSAFLQR
jgi:acyl-CoA thioester hydrolase